MSEMRGPVSAYPLATSSTVSSSPAPASPPFAAAAAVTSCRRWRVTVSPLLPPPTPPTPPAADVSVARSAAAWAAVAAEEGRRHARRCGLLSPGWRAAEVDAREGAPDVGGRETTKAAEENIADVAVCRTMRVVVRSPRVECDGVERTNGGCLFPCSFTSISHHLSVRSLLFPNLNPPSVLRQSAYLSPLKILM